MTIELQALATGIGEADSSSLGWEHANASGLSNDVLLAFVATVDPGRPGVVSATYGAEALTLIAETRGVGGSSFPAGYIFGLENPSTASGSVTVVFDEPVITLGGCSALFTGIDTAAGTLDNGFGGLALNTDYPDYAIGWDYTTSASGLVVDLCVSESSTHNLHLPGSGQIRIAEVELSGPKFSVTYRTTSSGGETATMRREDCGGPFGGVTLTIAELKGA